MSHRWCNLLSVVWWGMIPSLGRGREALGMTPSDALGWSFPSPGLFPHRCALILLTWRPGDRLSGQRPPLRSSALQTPHTLASHLPAPLTRDILHPCTRAWKLPVPVVSFDGRSGTHLIRFPSKRAVLHAWCLVSWKSLGVFLSSFRWEGTVNLCYPILARSWRPTRSHIWIYYTVYALGASLVAHTVENPPAMQETQVWSLDGEDPLEKGMATHSSILAWRMHILYRY